MWKVMTANAKQGQGGIVDKWIILRHFIYQSNLRGDQITEM